MVWKQILKDLRKEWTWAFFYTVVATMIAMAILYLSVSFSSVQRQSAAIRSFVRRNVVMFQMKTVQMEPNPEGAASANRQQKNPDAVLDYLQHSLSADGKAGSFVFVGNDGYVDKKYTQILILFGQYSNLAGLHYDGDMAFFVPEAHREDAGRSITISGREIEAVANAGVHFDLFHPLYYIESGNPLLSDTLILCTRDFQAVNKMFPWWGLSGEVFGRMVLVDPSDAEIDTFYTNSDGYLITPEKLEYGTGYSLVEVSAPCGYTLNSEPIYFDVTADNATEENTVTVVEVTKPNTAQKGVIRISKSGEAFSSVTEADGIYQPVFAVKGLEGAVYEITAAEDIITPDGTLRYAAGAVVDTVTTDETGLAESKPLYLGKYEVKEITAPTGYVLNTEIHTAELVYAGQEVEITETAADFCNERQKAAVSLDKVLEQDERFGIGKNGELSAVTFGLFAAEELTAADGSIIPADGLLEIVSMDENGHAVCKTDLPFGSYYLKELSTDGHYILSDEKYPIVFEYAGQDTALVEIKANGGAPIENKLLYGEIRGLKKNEGGSGLAGALIGLFRADCTEFTTENAILTATSAEDGSFSFTRVPYGNWIVREIEAPTGFVLSEKAYPVTVDADCAVIEVEIENTCIRGTVQLTKTDRDYPDNKLTGAEFTVYRDSNDNKELDADDERLGTLTETGIGVYEMSDLLYGGYFVKETKAPAGFYLDDNAYYFEIVEDGKIVPVENEAGKGFVNAPQVGSLKIIKTSSNGKIEGFSFRVTGPNGYVGVFTTDKNGEIIIENLRIGEYVVSEVSDGASSAYVLPADKTASVFEGAVTKVEMHNELRDTPKTGDDSNPARWLALLGVSAAGAATLGVVGFRKRRKEDAE